MPFQKGNKLCGMRGKKHSPETRLKMSISGKNKPPLSQEAREKISLKNKGKEKSPEWRAKISETKRKRAKYGKSAPNWKGGTTRLTQIIRSCFNYRQWRSDIFQRDNYCCTNCGKKSNGDIEAHHIKPLAKIISERFIKSLEEAINCEELWNINNGLTLCVECHKKTDTYCNTKNGKTKDSTYKL